MKGPGDPVPASCDVLIAGGGMVGASLAVALARLSLRVTLVEAIPAGSPGQQSFDARTTALSRSSQHILGTLGIWPQIAEHAAPIRRIHVSERGRLGTTVIDADEEGGEALGYVVENRLLGAALWRDLGAHSNVTVLTPARAASAAGAPDGLDVHIDQAGLAATVRTRLLVVADGARSTLRDALGIAARTRPYEQTAIVGNVAVDGPVAGLVAGQGTTAYERFTPDGPLALLPAGEGRYVFVLTRRAALAEAVSALPDPAFLELLQREFGFRLGRFRKVGARSCYPLELVEAEAVTGHRVAVVGNAAHGLHPVAGQGYNLGLRDAAALAELLAEDSRQAGAQPDPGAAALLERYATWRRPDQRKVVAFTDGLVRLFDQTSLGPLRGLGLLLFDTVPGAKRLLARETMGLAGRRTRLARGLPL
ncbi:MAG: 2-octaprenyl-6-methoxyphenyl hydroxylase [Gammaproteobacteria bacterium]|nr:2-octaprenyl-6-methoxyphenyl hydroxylase [Gammaproteobacteria bacterium]